MPVRRGFRRFVRRPKATTRWTADGFLLQLAAQAAPSGLRTTILTTADYEYGASGVVEPAGATLLAIRATLVVSSPRVRIAAVLPAAASACQFGISRIDTDDAAFVVGAHGDPTVTAELVDEDWLWLWTARGDATDVVTRELNIKVKRRLKDQSIAFVAVAQIGGAGTGDWVINMTSRCLLGYAGNA